MTHAAIILASGDPEGQRFFIDLLVILAAAAIVATIFRRAKLETIPGYLVAGALAGAVAGPGGLGIIRDTNEVESISGLAIILLMFSIGLMLDTGSMRRGMLPILGVGAVSTLLNVLAGWPIVMAFGNKAAPALVIAMAMSMSSTAVLLRILQQRRELRQMHGRVCVGVSIVQDIVSVLLMAMIPPIAVWAGATAGVSAVPLDEDTGLSASTELVRKGALYFGGIIAMLAAGRVLLPRLVGAVARSEAHSGSSELVLVLSAAIAMGSALATAALKFSPEMGAFLAGLMLSFTPFRHQLAGQIAPMKDLLMAVFFTAIGLKISPQVLGAHWVEITAGVAILIVLKAGVLGLTSWAFGAAGSVSVLTGVYLAQAGEFSLVILGVADRAAVFHSAGVGVPIAVVVLSLMISPMLVNPAHRLAARLSGVRPPPWLRRSLLVQSEKSDEGGVHDGAEGREGTVLIAGFGPVGRHLADKFQRTGRPYTIIELNPVTVFKQHRMGRPIVYGDVTNPEVLETAGIRHAEALILTIPDEDAIVRAVEIARRIAPGLFIAARTNYLSQAIQARQAGADHVTVEEVATAGLMEREVMEKLAARRRARESEASGEQGADAGAEPPVTAP